MESELLDLSHKVRSDIIELAFRCEGPAHLGGALSIVEILSTLFGGIMRHDPLNALWEERDRFILSKGHGVLAYYAVLHRSGYFSREILETFKKNGSDLIAHPVMNLSLGIESSNGSLGHGLSMSVGVAWALKQKRSFSKVFTLIGDGECDEGSIWEAAMSASRFKLDNLTAIIDCNGFQSDGRISEDNSLEYLRDKWTSHGWKVATVSGNDISNLLTIFRQTDFNESDGLPRVILAKTKKGHGISFMQDNNAWHHNRLTESFYEKARSEIAGE